MSWTITKQQYEIINDESRFKTIVAGRRWGKTYLALLDALKRGLAVNSQKIWYVSPTYRQSKNIAWQLLKNLIYVYSGYLSKRPNESELSINLINGTSISLKGADNEDSLRGVGLNHIIADEFQHVKREAWTEVLRPTLTDTRGTAMFIGTPDGFNFFYEVYEKGLKGEDGFRSWKYRTIDSPFISPDEIESARSELDERTFRQEYEASFETVAGRTYYAFNRGFNLTNVEYNPMQEIILCLDFNTTPMSWAIVQTVNGIDYVVDELVIRDTNTYEAAKIFRDKFPHSSVIVYGDYSGTARQSSSRSTDYEIIKQVINPKDIRIKPNPRVVDRVNAVNSRLCNAKGERRLFVNAKCKELIKDFEQVQNKQNSRDIDKTDINRTHISDALGYYVEYEYSLKGKPSITQSQGLIR